MIDLVEAKKDLGLNKNWGAFKEKDPFNPENTLAGFIHKTGKSTYGMLYLVAINGKETDQKIYGTPKQEYPFDKKGNYDFPPAKNVRVYEKLDGTNILQYTYYHESKQFTSYKTRLLPFTMTHRPFYSMWLEMLEKYPMIKDIASKSGLSISYELYGHRNTHLIKYEVDLDVAMLFGVNQDGLVIIPEKIDAAKELPIPRLETVIDSKAKLESEYNKHRQEMETHLNKLDEDTYEGQEGQVWYVTDLSNRCWQFKAKPETIEAIHFAAGRRMGKNSIIATCWNVFEDHDELNYDNLKPLLLEEWDEGQVNENEDLIRRCISFVNNRKRIKENAFSLLNQLEQEHGWTMENNKREIMRSMGDEFGRENSKIIYNVLIGRI